MKLIDRDLFLKAIEATPQFDSVSELLKRVIEHFPISYDTEKVIEQIEDLDRHMDCGDFSTCQDMLVVLKDVLEIVECGGVEE